MITFMPLDYFATPLLYFLNFLVVIILVGLVIVALACRSAIRRITRPLSSFADSADEIAKGNFQAELPQIRTKDEMQRLRNSFELMQSSLVRQIRETREINEEKGRMEGELLAARNIQMSMLPKTFPPYPDRNDVDIYAQLTPAKEVGGDLFDFYIRDEKLLFCVGDVSGKGIPASLVMAVTRSLFRSVSAHESQPSRIMTAINSAMVEGNESEMFVTLFIGVLDLPTGRLRYCNAGHNAPLLLRPEGTDWLPCDPNLPIGIMDELKFTGQETLIAPQTLLFLYTDGLTEAETVSHQQFQEERVLQVARQSQLQPQTLIEEMTGAVHHFVEHAEQNDDMTMLAVLYCRKQETIRLQRTLTLTNNIDEVPQLSAFVEAVGEALSMDASVTMQINLAIEEAVVNVMSYAYPGGISGMVSITAQASDEQVQFVITDNGIPFDPTRKDAADTTLSVEERPIGGLGIHLIRHYMDGVAYERVGEQNVFTMRKQLKKNISTRDGSNH
jgi:sigma-B regulation protein RsbU (phosphoserine phosphatase)